MLLPADQLNRLQEWIHQEFPYWCVSSMKYQPEADGSLGIVLTVEEEDIPFYMPEKWDGFQLSNKKWVCNRGIHLDEI